LIAANLICGKNSLSNPGSDRMSSKNILLELGLKTKKTEVVPKKATK